jgi:hypothetical protein
VIYPPPPLPRTRLQLHSDTYFDAFSVSSAGGGVLTTQYASLATVCGLSVHRKQNGKMRHHQQATSSCRQTQFTSALYCLWVCKALRARHLADLKHICSNCVAGSRRQGASVANLGTPAQWPEMQLPIWICILQHCREGDTLPWGGPAASLFLLSSPPPLPLPALTHTGSKLRVRLAKKNEGRRPYGGDCDGGCGEDGRGHGKGGRTHRRAPLPTRLGRANRCCGNMCAGWQDACTRCNTANLGGGVRGGLRVGRGRCSQLPQ